MSPMVDEVTPEAPRSRKRPLLVSAAAPAFLADTGAVDEALPVERRHAPMKRAAAAAAELIQILATRRARRVSRS